jgi:hypothetical protein
LPVVNAGLNKLTEVILVFQVLWSVGGVNVFSNLRKPAPSSVSTKSPSDIRKLAMISKTAASV